MNITTGLVPDARDVDTVAFSDLDEIYLADSCEALEQAACLGEVTLRAFVRGHYPGQELPEAAVRGVLSVGSWDASRDQSWGLPWHRNEGIEITLVERGGVVFSIEGERWNLGAGQVVITRPWQRHKLGNPNVGSSSVHWIIIDVDIRRPNQSWQWPSWVGLSETDLARLTVLLQQNEHPLLPNLPALRNSVVAATSSAQNEPPNLDSHLRITISRVLLEILRALEAENRDLDESLTAPQRGVKMFLSDLPSALGHPWTVPMMAKLCSMSTAQFTTLCKDMTNATPLQYLNNLRIAEAERLLLESEESIATIAARCGFESARYFTTKFRLVTGRSPSKYRNDALPDERNLAPLQVAGTVAPGLDRVRAST